MKKRKRKRNDQCLCCPSTTSKSVLWGHCCTERPPALAADEGAHAPLGWHGSAPEERLFRMLPWREQKDVGFTAWFTDHHIDNRQLRGNRRSVTEQRVKRAMGLRDRDVSAIQSGPAPPSLSVGPVVSGNQWCQDWVNALQAFALTKTSPNMESYWEMMHSRNSMKEEGGSLCQSWSPSFCHCKETTKDLHWLHVIV